MCLFVDLFVWLLWGSTEGAGILEVERANVKEMIYIELVDCLRRSSERLQHD